MSRRISEQSEAWRRLYHTGVPFKANDNIAGFIDADDIAEMKDKVEVLIGLTLDALLIDHNNDPNSRGTPKRFAKMLVDEAMRGRYYQCPPVTTFPNTRKLDEMYTTGPITLNSMCSHHLVPIIGKAWIGVVPGDRVIGLSKFNRVVEWVARRPQIQEELVVQIADELWQRLEQPRGLAVVIEATHLCMTWRGVEESVAAVMRTNVVRGCFREDAAARAEFFASVK